MVGRWTADQQVKRSILRQGMIRNKIHLLTQVVLAQSSQTVQNYGPKAPFISSTFLANETCPCLYILGEFAHPCEDAAISFTPRLQGGAAAGSLHVHTCWLPVSV